MTMPRHSGHLLEESRSRFAVLWSRNCHFAPFALVDVEIPDVISQVVIYVLTSKNKKTAVISSGNCRVSKDAAWAAFVHWNNLHTHNECDLSLKENTLGNNLHLLQQLYWCHASGYCSALQMYRLISRTTTGFCCFSGRYHSRHSKTAGHHFYLASC